MERKQVFADVNAQIATLKLAKCMILTRYKTANQNKLAYYQKLRARIDNGEEAAINEALNIHSIKLRR